MSESFLAAAQARAVKPASERPTLGGRDVDEHGVNRGLLRCPRCFTRMVSTCGVLCERAGTEVALWVPNRPSGDTTTTNDTSSATIAEEEMWEWTSAPHAWWWKVGSMDDVDNLGLSRVVTSPAGPLKLAMCCECSYGPFGFQRDGEPTIWLACEMLHQQDPSLATAQDDFRAPEGISMEMLQGMIDSGMAIVQYHVSFDEQVLGMQLADAEDGLGVEVVAFTAMDDGEPLAAERSGQVAVGDKVSRVNGRGTAGMNYAAVLDMVREAARPVTINFERKGIRAAPAERVAHQAW